MPKTKAVKKKAGRPTKYKEEYCELLIKHMAEGLSLEAFAGVVGVNQDTIHEWVKKHPKFSEAKSLGLPLARLFWEKLARGIALGKIQGANAAVAIFCLKNRLGWRDKQPDEIRNAEFQPVIIELPNKGKTLKIDKKQ